VTAVRRWVVAGLLLGCVGGLGTKGHSAAAEADLDQLRGTAKVQALIEKVVERQRSVTSLRARFTQLKKSSLLLGPVQSVGEFSYLAPDRVRWDYQAPDEMVVLFADDTVTTFHPRQHHAERVKISRRHQRFVGVLAGTQPLDELQAQFRITLADPGGSAPFRFTLDPIHRTLAKRLRSVVLDIDRELLLPISVEYTEPDGDVTRFEFSALELNPPIDDGRFNLELGEDVRVEWIDASAGES
jgi:outer membrane lipoprotein-sorting protein